MGFRAVVVDRDAEGRTRAAVREIELADLPDGDVTVAVEYSTLNYKDGLCLGPGAGLVRTVSARAGHRLRRAGGGFAAIPRYRPGDPVVLTGWRVGEAHWGGYAEKARVRADWLVPLPEGLSLRQAMAIGTAGLAAMLAVMALEEHGLAPAPRAGAGDGRGRRRGLGRGGGAGAARPRGRRGDRPAGERGLPAPARGGADRAAGGARRAGRRGRSSPRPGRAAWTRSAGRCWRG